MSDRFQNKYRIKSARLKNWDYGWNAAYFVTICTKDRKHYFGEIIHGKIQVTPAGSVAYVLWHEIKNHVQNIRLGEFVVMPNHVHGILILNGNDVANVGRDVGTGVADMGRDVACNVSTETEPEPEPKPKWNPNPKPI